ncbi:MAG TPA: NAD-dependent epimerase/dehydratase family protein [Geminicoccaceae bacterium]
MPVLVTGAAGFVGFHVSRALLARGGEVVGIDNLNAYYDPALKRARLERLSGLAGFTFRQADIADPDAVRGIVRDVPGLDRVVHLAAQAGVRYSLEHPFAYVESNLRGHMAILEACRHELPDLRHLVYASSSSVYGANQKIPFSVDDPVDQPVSLYAATKRSNELMSRTYAHLFGLPQTGLRFFTVYGPYGRPDMAYYLFTDAIANGRPITLFNEGRMERDFTWIDDVVDGVIRALDRPPAAADGDPPHRIYNLGNHRPTPLGRFVGIIEEALGRRAEIRHAPLPPGDVLRTYADIKASRRDLGFEPKTGIEEGLNRFVAWYREYHGA